MPVKTTFEIIKELIKSKKYNVPKLAEATGIPEQRMYKWFSKKATASPKTDDMKILEEWYINLEQVPEKQNGLTIDIDRHLPIGKIDYRDKYEALLEKTNAEQSAILTTVISLMNKVHDNVDEIKTNLNSAIKDQRLFAAMNDKNQEVALEALAEIQKKPKSHLVEEAYNRGVEHLLKMQGKGNHVVLDKAGKS